MPDQALTLLRDRELRVDLPLSGWRLVPGVRGEVGLPLDAFLHLFAVCGEEVIEIGAPMDLAPLVARIEDEASAWRFLRLLTSPDSHHLLQRGRSLIDRAESPSGVGAIREAAAHRVPLRPPEIRWKAGGWTAWRDLLSWEPDQPSGPVTLVRRCERLTPQVDYRLLRDEEVASLRRADVELPYRE